MALVDAVLPLIPLQWLGGTCNPRWYYEAVIRWTVWAGLGVAPGCSEEVPPNNHMCSEILGCSKGRKIWAKRHLWKAHTFLEEWSGPTIPVVCTSWRRWTRSVPHRSGCSPSGLPLPSTANAVGGASRQSPLCLFCLLLFTLVLDCTGTHCLIAVCVLIPQF